MSLLYTTLTTLTKENTQKRVENQLKKKEEYISDVNSCMIDLYNYIMNTNYEEKMKNAANEGYNKCTLFEFKKGEKFNNYPLIFLTRGPSTINNSVGGYKYFEQNKIYPYIHQLQKAFPEFRIVFNTNNKSYNTSIEIMWT